MIFNLNAPMFDFLVLSVIEKNDAYGYQISQVIKRASNAKDSTLYPVLKRLQEQNYVETYDQPYQGRNRRYYTITDTGRKQYDYLTKEWEEYKSAIDEIIKGGVEQ